MNNKKITAISLGWGVQSWVLAAMSALGELPKVDYAIHSDTTWEHESTYQFAKEWTPWLEKRGIEVVTVDDKNVSHNFMNTGSATPPLYTLNFKSAGQLKRTCTSRWKITPMRRFIATELTRRSMPKSPGIVEQWLGITTDEWQRAKDSDVKYIEHKFPLLDLGMSRQDCIDWLNNNNLPSPGKSSCTFCPYHSLTMWQSIKRKGGADWEQAVMVDEKIRHLRPGYQSFVWNGKKPIIEIPLPEDFGSQTSMFDLLDFDDKDAECDSGFCFL